MALRVRHGRVVFVAIQRESEVNQDPSDNWAWVELPLDKIWRRLNILPKR